MKLKNKTILGIVLIGLLIGIAISGGYAFKSLHESGFFMGNYIKPCVLDEDKEGELLSNALKESGEYPFAFEYKTDSSIYGIKIRERVYEKGILTRDDMILEKGMESKQRGNIVIRVRDNGKTSIIASTGEGSFAPDDRKVTDENYGMFSTTGLTETRDLGDDEIVLVGAYYTNGDEMSVLNASEVRAEEQQETLKDVDCYVIYSCQFVR